jgi:hypothetical protein
MHSIIISFPLMLQLNNLVTIKTKDKARLNKISASLSLQHFKQAAVKCRRTIINDIAIHPSTKNNKSIPNI